MIAKSVGLATTQAGNRLPWALLAAVLLMRWKAVAIALVPTVPGDDDEFRVSRTGAI